MPLKLSASGPVCLLVGILLATAPASSFAAAPAAGSAQAWAKAKVEDARKLAMRKVEAGTPAEEAWHTDAKKIIEELLDWDTMTKESLGSTWKDLKPDQQKEFSALLREIIEASYQSKLKLATKGSVKKPKEVKIDWLGAEENGDKAKVSAKIKADKTVAQLDFQLLWNGDHWRVWDIAIDDVSTVRTYKTQFRKHIAEKGFPGLIELMKKKSVDIREGRGDIQ